MASTSPKQSIREFQIVIEKNPKHELAHNNLAEVLRLNRRYDEALTNAVRPWNSTPNCPRAIVRWPISCLAKNDLDGAMEHFQTALKLKPDDPLVHEGLADVLWRQGKFREAVEHRKQQVALQPQNTAMTIKVVARTHQRPAPRGPLRSGRLGDRPPLVRGDRRYKDILALDVLAAAYAETGDFAQAEATVRKAMETPLGQTPNNADRVAEAADPLPCASEAHHSATVAVIDAATA